MTLIPKVKLKTIVSFPAAVYGGTGIAVRKENGSFYFDISFADFAPPVTGLLDPVHQNALIWNSVTGVYSLTPVTVFGGAGGIPDSPADGNVYGRLNAAWAKVSGNVAPLIDGVASAGVSNFHSRQDHVHPTDTTRAPLASPVFTGDPQAPTPPPGDNDTSIATTAFVVSTVAGSGGPSGGIPEAPADSNIYGRRNLAWTVVTAPIPSAANPIMDGVAAPGVAVSYARGDHVHPSDTSRAALASPIFTGTPSGPTPPPADFSTRFATTAFVNQDQLFIAAADFNTLTKPGTYATAGGNQNPNEPTGAGQWYVHVITYGGSAAYLVQIAYSLLGDGTAYTRACLNSVWQPWVPVGLSGISRVVVAAGAVAIAANDSVVAINKTVGAATACGLPLAINKIGPVTISDFKRDAGTNNITISPSGGELIQGLATLTLAANGASVRLFPLPGVGYAT